MATGCGAQDVFSGICAMPPTAADGLCFDPRVPSRARRPGEELGAKRSSRRTMTPAANGRPQAPKPSCEGCYFRVNLLCALEVEEPCSTFRPHEAQLQP